MEDLGHHALFQLLVLENLPYAVLIILVALVSTRLLTRSMDALGERFTEWRLALKQVSAVCFAISSDCSRRCKT